MPFTSQMKSWTRVWLRRVLLRKSTLGLEPRLWCSFCSCSSQERGRQPAVPFFTAMCTSTALAWACWPCSSSQRGLSGRSRTSGRKSTASSEVAMV
uniref:Uncharacterized protein n=1 Tax=Ixodes ricinus TaxID=34613 RepID=A0A6B0U421_IXORI